ncbi:TIM barrel protein [Candidatus Poribacteria bacterium]|nr:TIM barrel protein [Candidatus Poribacteria bacterium]
MIKIGAMNNPMKNLLREIQWIGENNFDFIDLTLEPPGALAEEVDVESVRDLLNKYRLDVIGHTAYYLPIASPYQRFADLAVDELRRCFIVFQMLEVQKVNLHPDELAAGILSKERAIVRNIKAIERIEKEASNFGLKLILENSLRIFNSVKDFNRLFESVDGVGFHLDVGHANLNTEKNKTPELLENFADRLEHVHMSDNKSGNADLHLPLGAGLIPWNKMISALKKSGYDGTITLEVFSRDKRYLLASRDKLLEMWGED